MTVCVLPDLTWLPLLGVGGKLWYIIIIGTKHLHLIPVSRYPFLVQFGPFHSSFQSPWFTSIPCTMALNPHWRGDEPPESGRTVINHLALGNMAAPKIHTLTHSLLSSTHSNPSNTVAQRPLSFLFHWRPPSHHPSNQITVTLASVIRNILLATRCSSILFNCPHSSGHALIIHSL